MSFGRKKRRTGPKECDKRLAEAAHALSRELKAAEVADDVKRDLEEKLAQNHIAQLMFEALGGRARMMERPRELD